MFGCHAADGGTRPAPGGGRAAVDLDRSRLPHARACELAAEVTTGARDICAFHGEAKT